MVKYDWEEGLIFGSFRLSGKSYFDSSERRRYVEVFCDCGVNKWVRWDSIKRGLSTSCGCIVKERLRNTKPASTHGISDHHLYSVYKHIKLRCYDETDESYQSYGKIGVTMCDEWKNDIMAFYNWAIDRWVFGLQLDKDILYSIKHGTKTGLIYSPEYCCFVTPKDNRRQTSRARFIEHNGETRTLTEWAEKTGIKTNAIGERLDRYGWSIEKALTTPTKPHKYRTKNG